MLKAKASSITPAQVSAMLAPFFNRRDPGFARDPATPTGTKPAPAARAMVPA